MVPHLVTAAIAVSPNEMFGQYQVLGCLMKRVGLISLEFEEEGEDKRTF